MSRSLAGLGVLMAILALAACGRFSAVATVAPGESQTIAGFGASGSWWPIDLAAFSPANQQKAEALLFGPQGLELSVYRYNIGAGGVGVKTYDRAPQTFLVSPGVYDWSEDQAGLTFLQAASAAHVPILIGFANSAPPVWKSPNGTAGPQSCGGQLLAQDIPAYAAYLTDIAAHFHDDLGVTLTDISPMNEPDYTFNTCGQEGMRVPPSERAPLVIALATDLRARAPYTQVIADESSQVAKQLLPEAPDWLPQAASYIAAIAHHTYDFPDSATLRRSATELAVYAKPIWMTEICCYTGKGYGPQYNPTISGAMWMADDIWRDLTQEGDASFQWWLAFSNALGSCQPQFQTGCATQINPTGWNDGLAYYDPEFRADGNQNFYLTKRFWVMANFSRYVRPGAVLHKVSGAPLGLRVLSFSTSNGWVVVTINDARIGSPNARLRLSLPTSAPLRAVAAYQTSATLNCQPVTLPRVGGHILIASLPAQSVTTFLLT